MSCTLNTLDEVDKLVANAGGVVAAVVEPAAEVVTEVSSVGGRNISRGLLYWDVITIAGGSR